MSRPMGRPQALAYALILVAGVILALTVSPLEKGSPREASTGREAAPPPRQPESVARLGSNQLALGRLVANFPDGWVMEEPASSMRLAQFRLPADQPGQEDAELAVFSGIGGGTRDNLNRWFGQFVQPDGSASGDKARVETVTMEDIRVTTADLTGTYTGAGMTMSPSVDKPGYRLLAAIVETFSDTYYFKLVGPEPTVGRWAPSFATFIRNLRYAGP